MAFPALRESGGEPSSKIRRGDWKLIHYYEDNRNELYNLANDIGETTDLSAQYPQKVAQLNQELFDYLSEVGAKYPEPDPEYSETAEQNFLYKLEHEKMPALEKHRLEMLSKTFQPGDDWWGSKINTTD